MTDEPPADHLDAMIEDQAPAMDALRNAKRVLVLQGGGALGSYQAGIYQAMDRHAMWPDWVAGISIGAINAAIIAGNPPERRVERLRAFWENASSGLVSAPLFQEDSTRSWFNQLNAGFVTMFGAPGFFVPRVPPLWFFQSEAPESLGIYDTRPLRDTLLKLVDFDRINRGETRLTVGAVNVLTGNSVVFDSTKQKIEPEHIMASGALPPGLPPIVIDGQPYWDGGLVSNTPLQFVLDMEYAENLIVLQVDLFNARGPMPRTLSDIDERVKDIRYSSRTRMNTDMNLRIYQAKAATRSLLAALPDELSGRPDVALLREVSRENSVVVVQLIYRKRAFESGIKDYEFSRQTMLDHWSAGVADMDRFEKRAKSLLPPTIPDGILIIDPGLPE